MKFSHGNSLLKILYHAGYMYAGGMEFKKKIYVVFSSFIQL